MFNTLTQHRWPFNSAVQGDKRCRYAAERHRAKTLATSSVTSKVNPGRQYQAAATRVLTSGQSSFDSVKPGIPDFTYVIISPSALRHHSRGGGAFRCKQENGWENRKLKLQKTAKRS